MNDNVSMPSVGQSSFLHNYSGMYCSGTLSCQCPQSGNPHFYPAILQKRYPEPYLCQCPQSGNPHFYPALLELAI